MAKCGDEGEEESVGRGRTKGKVGDEEGVTLENGKGSEEGVWGVKGSGGEKDLEGGRASAKINISYSILFNLTTSYSSYFGGKKGISRNKTSFFLLMRGW